MISTSFFLNPLSLRMCICRLASLRQARMGVGEEEQAENVTLLQGVGSKKAQILEQVRLPKFHQSIFSYHIGILLRSPMCIHTSLILHGEWKTESHGRTETFPWILSQKDTLRITWTSLEIMGSGFIISLLIFDWMSR